MDPLTWLALGLIALGAGGIFVRGVRRALGDWNAHDRGVVSPRDDGTFHVDCLCRTWHKDVETLTDALEAHQAHRDGERAKLTQR